jgi:hypothetical protein
MRRQPTPEQKQKAAERRERFRVIAKQVAAMTPEERTALVMQAGAILTCEGRELSMVNSCLVLTQRPGASMVGGFRQWKDKGRSVRKGEHGLMIWIPVGRGKDDTPTAADLDAGSEGNDARPRFLMGTVFDVSQTEAILDGPELYRRAAAACAASQL